MIDLRDERPGDARAIHDLQLAAFNGSETEPAIVRLARKRGQITYSIVAESAGRIVGHVLASPMTLAPASELRCIAVGPIGVATDLQSAGIGSRLMREVIDRAKEDGHDAILLLGDPRYYHRFGFRTAPVRNEYGAGDAFMALQLTPGCLDKLGGAYTAKYISAFADAEGG